MSLSSFSATVSSTSNGTGNFASTSATMIPTSVTPGLGSPEEPSGWIIYSAGIIAGVVFLELVVVSLMVMCRRCQIGREERAKESVYSKNINSCVVTELEPQSQSNLTLPNSAVILPSSGPLDETTVNSRECTSIELEYLTGNEASTAKRQDPKLAKLKQKDKPMTGVEELMLADPLGASSNHEFNSPPSTDTRVTATPDLSAPRQLNNHHQDSSSGRDIIVGQPSTLKQLSKGNGVRERRCLSVDQLQVTEDEEKEHAFEVLDELQKEIHILSQSIPVLDVFGNEIVKPKPPAPKISRSIPLLLDTAGYEDLDVIRPRQAHNIGRNERSLATGQYLSEKFQATTRPEKRVTSAFNPQGYPPLTSPHATDTASQKKQSATQVTVGEGKKAGEPGYSVIQKKPKTFSVSDLTEDPPLVPPMTADTLYTAVQRSRETSTHHHSTIITNECLPLSVAVHNRGKDIPAIKAHFSTDINEQKLGAEAFESVTTALAQPYRLQEGNPPTLDDMHPATVKANYSDMYSSEDELEIWDL